MSSYDFLSPEKGHPSGPTKREPTKRKEVEYINPSYGSRRQGTRIFFNTGVSWMGGFFAGGIFGSVEGLRNAANSNFSVRLNSILNGFSRRGGMVGNALGVLVFTHSVTVYAADEFKLESYINSPFTVPVAAGAVTGIFYKSTRGIRAASLAGVIGAGASCTMWFIFPYFYDTFLSRNIGRKIKYTF